MPKALSGTLRTVKKEALFPWQAAFILALLPLLGFFATGLFDLDEGFYGAIVAEMNRRGEWITPYYNGNPWFEKPVLLYWICKPFVALFGEHGPRVAPVLCTLCIYWLTFRMVRSRFGLTEAVWSLLVLSSSILMFATGQMMMTDVPLILSLCGCFWAFLESLQASGSKRVMFRCLAAFALGCAVLAKGPVGCVFFVLLAIWTYRAEPELRPRFAGGWPQAVVVFLVVVASWYVPAYLANPQLFVDEFLIRQNLQRFAGGDTAHKDFPTNILMYPVILLLGFAPWWYWLKKAWPTPFGGFFQTLNPDEKILARYSARWAILIFVFFFISGSKLMHYILPIWPALAVIVGPYLARQTNGKLTLKNLAFPISISLGMTLVSWFGMQFWYTTSGQREAHSLVRVVREQKGGLAAYQISRREKSKGTGGTKIMETALPSIGFYLNDTFSTPETPEELGADPARFVFTRPGRLSDDEISALKLKKVGQKSENYVLYEKIR